MVNKIILDDLEFIYRSSINWSRFKNKTILITGAYGMLASFMIRMFMYLNEKNPTYNIRVIGIGRSLEKVAIKFPEYLERKDINFLVRDVCNPIDIDEKIDFIIHAASLASSQYYGTNPVDTLKPNVIGTYHLLELARKNQVEGFLFFSSGEVYGETSKHHITETDYGYLDPLELRSCYGESKRMGENMCKAWQHQYNVPAKIVRIAHTYGPTMELENDNRVFSEFVSDIVNYRDILMKSDGTSYRSFCYISDTTVGLFKVLLEGQPCKAYNVCNDQGSISIGDLAKLLVSMFPERGLKVVLKKREEDETYLERLESKPIILENSKIKQLGWQPVYSVEEGFRRTIKSFELCIR